MALLRPRRRRWRRGTRLARPDRRGFRQDGAAGFFLGPRCGPRGRPYEFALAVAAEHAFCEDLPTWAFELFARLFDLLDGEIDHELVAGLFVERKDFKI